MKNAQKLMILLIALIVCVGVVSAAPIRTKVPLYSNENCGDISCPGAQFKIEAGMTVDPSGATVKNIATLVGTETYTNSDTFQVRVTVQALDPTDPSFDPDGDAKLITWVSNAPVYAVITKDGGGQDVYAYKYTDGGVYTGVYSDQKGAYYGGLEVPPNANTYGSISHITFCYARGTYPPLPPPVPTPEFPTSALPAGMIIGIVGLVYVIKGREK